MRAATVATEIELHAGIAEVYGVDQLDIVRVADVEDMEPFKALRYVFSSTSREGLYLRRGGVVAWSWGIPRSNEQAVPNHDVALATVTVVVADAGARVAGVADVDDPEPVEVALIRVRPPEGEVRVAVVEGPGPLAKGL